MAHRQRHGQTATRRLRALASGAALTLVGALGLAAGGVGGVTVAHADTAPLPPPPGSTAQPTPATVSNTPLPTWQIDGVAWSQVLVGNTVYVTGAFNNARPPKTPVGSPQSVPAQNLFAYDITTGNRVPTFNHSLNGQGLAITASPDGKRIYVAGDFTTVDNVARGHIAAFDTATGALVTDFAPDVNAQVDALSATNTTVYAGGSFSAANGASRGRLAAFTTKGALTAWAPNANSRVRAVLALGDKVVVGGQFLTLNGQSVYGQGAVDLNTGASLPWQINQVIHDYNNGGITSLHSPDGKTVYGTAFAFGAGGTFEGPFAANASDGSVAWIADCQGDTYDSATIDGAVYFVGHTHDCTMIGGFPDTAGHARQLRSLAVTATATQLSKGPDVYGWNFKDQPAPSLLHWYPNFPAGTASGQGQAGWSVVGNSKYVAVGGEFPSVNNLAQNGLVRFAKVASPTVAPTWQPIPTDRALVAPTGVPLGARTLRITFQTAWDRDNENLTYKVYRDRGTPAEALVATTTYPTSFWNLPDKTIIDRNVTAGDHTYQVSASDPSGNVIWSQVSAPITATDGKSTYVGSVVQDGATSLWRLDEAAGNTSLYDAIGTLDGGVSTGVTRGAAGAISGDPDTASTFDGSAATAYAPASGPIAAPDTFTVEAWFQTTSSAGGKIVGFGNAKTGLSATYDRHIYVDAKGRVTFGVNPGTVRTVTSPLSYTDGAWHQVVGTLSGDGLALYVDGVLVGRDRNVTSAQPGRTGYWRIGGDKLTTAWPAMPTSNFFAGSIDDVAVYPSALTPAQVAAHFTAAGREISRPSTVTDGYGTSVTASKPLFYWRLDETGGPLIRDFSGNDTNGAYGGTIGYGVPGVVAGDAAVRFAARNQSLSTLDQTIAPSASTGELWFRADPAKGGGGVLLDFGDARTGSSARTDRALSLTDAGTLRLTTASGSFVESTGTFRDGQWHHAAITSAEEGSHLIVDGVDLGTTTTGPTPTWAGFWRVGSDRPQPGAASGTVLADIDEVAVYPRVVPLAELKAHVRAAGKQVVNVPPTGTIAVATEGRTVSLSAQANDPDGTVTGYSWNFGDGSPAVDGATASHVYAPGTYQVTLTLTDNEGAKSTVTQQVQVVNAMPSAEFTADATGLILKVDATADKDPDGTITSYAWDFGDGTPAVTGTNATLTHTFAQPGTYQVSLKTTDNDGATATSTQPITVARTKPPVAAFTANGTTQVATFDASTSVDPDGTIASYAWDFGDGATGTGVKPTHRYASPGDYQVTLVVTDDAGATDQIAHPVTVKNAAPIAAFTKALAGTTVTVDAAASKDTDGTIASYVWDFGDGSDPATGVTASHTYAKDGTYQVTLTVTDDSGAPAKTTAAVTVVSNKAPVAAFTASATALTAKVDASTSSDADGTVASYSWSFGDGTAAVTGKTASHTYAAAGTYTVTLTVTDDAGAKNSATKAVTVAANAKPVAALTVTPAATGDGRTVSVDGSGSTDSDGTVASYSWSFGDGTAAVTGKTASHTYAATGTYTVTLTVTDDAGATGTATKQVTISGPLARDTFARTVTKGWGSADTGGAWSLLGSASYFAVNGGYGRLTTNAGSGVSVLLPSVTDKRTEVSGALGLDKQPAGGGFYATVIGRGTTSDNYTGKLYVSSAGALTASIGRTVAGTESTLRSVALSGASATFAPGTDYRFRMQVVGTAPAAVNFKVWPAGTAEPTAWTVTATDSTAALQSASGIGFRTYLSGAATNAPVVMRVDDVTVTTVP